MKPSSLSTLSLLLFFVFLNSLPLLAFSSDVEEVVDVKGNPISTDGEYYIVSAIWGAGGGGLKLGKTGNALCPNTVLQEFFDTRYGLPLKFKIPGESNGTIFTDTPLEIEFSYRPKCSSSSKWLMFFDNEIKKICVGIGGPEDHPEEQIYGGTFKIQKLASFAYKLQFCGADSTTCNDIGKYNAKNGAEGGMRLIVTEDIPFMIVFIDYASGIDLIRKYGAE